MKNITVIGVGYVGLVTGACFADLGNRVVCLDVNEERIADLQQGIMPIYRAGAGGDGAAQRERRPAVSSPRHMTDALNALKRRRTWCSSPWARPKAWMARPTCATCARWRRPSPRRWITRSSSSTRAPCRWARATGWPISSCSKQPHADPLQRGQQPRVPARGLGHQRFHEPRPRGARLARPRCGGEAWRSSICRCARRS